MSKKISKVINFQEYKEKRRQLEVDRGELLNLIKKVVKNRE